MFSIESVSFKNNPVSFCENLLTSTFYFKYLYPADCESTNFTSDLLKKHIEDCTKSDPVVHSQLYGIGRVVFALLGLPLAAPIGVLWNGACAFKTLFFWTCHRVAQADQGKLHELIEKTKHYAYAAFQDFKHCGIPLVMMGVRQYILFVGKINHHEPWKRMPQVVQPLSEQLKFIGTMGLGLIAASGVYFLVVFQLMKAFESYTYPTSSIASTMASDSVPKEHIFLALRLREKLGLCEANQLLSPEKALQSFKAVYKELQQQLGDQVFELTRLLVPYNSDKEKEQMIIPPLRKIDDLGAWAATFAKDSLFDSCAQELQSKIVEISATIKQLQYSEQLVAPIYLSFLDLDSKEFQNSYLQKLLGLRPVSFYESKKIKEHFRKTLISSKLFLIDFYADCVTEEESNGRHAGIMNLVNTIQIKFKYDERVANGVMPDVKNVWDINLLIAHLLEIQEKVKPELKEDFNQTLKELRKARTELYFCNTFIDVPFLKNEWRGGRINVSGIYYVDELIDSKQAYQNEMLDKMHQAEIALVNQTFFKVHLLMFRLNIKPNYSFPCNGDVVAYPLEQYLTTQTGVQAAPQNVIEEQIAILKKLQTKITFYKEQLLPTKSPMRTMLDEYKLIDYLRRQYGRYIGEAEVDVVECIMDINTQIASFKSIQWELIPYELPIQTDKVIYSLRTLLDVHCARFGNGLKQYFGQLLSRLTMLSEKINVNRVADQFLLEHVSSIKQPEAVKSALWESVTAKQSVVSIDLPEKIKELERGIVKTVARINSEILFMKEQLKRLVLPIPYACPLDGALIVNQFRTILQTFVERQKFVVGLGTDQREKNQRFVDGLKEELEQIEKNQKLITVLRGFDLKVRPDQPQPVLYMNSEEYCALFNENVIASAATAEVQKALDACKLDVSFVATEASPHYIEFKSKIVAYHLAVERGETPKLDVFYYFGLKEGCSNEEYKKVKKQFLLNIRASAINTTQEARSLFDCMNSLFQIAENRVNDSWSKQKNEAKQLLLTQ